MCSDELGAHRFHSNTKRYPPIEIITTIYRCKKTKETFRSGYRYKTDFEYDVSNLVLAFDDHIDNYSRASLIPTASFLTGRQKGVKTLGTYLD